MTLLYLFKWSLPTFVSLYLRDYGLKS